MSDDRARRPLRIRKAPEIDTPIRGDASFTHSSRTYETEWRERPSPFWSAKSRAGWRRDLAESVYLPRAVLDLGHHLYGSEWNDDDLARTYIPQRLLGDGDDLEAIRAWTRIHAVFDELVTAAQANKMQVRIEEPIGSVLRTVLPASPDMLLVCPRHWFAQPTLEQIFYDCSLDPMAPWEKRVRSGFSTGCDTFVDRNGLAEIMSHREMKIVRAATAKAVAPSSEEFLRELIRVARVFDARGVRVRDVRAPMIAKEWDYRVGKPPKTENVTERMTGKPAGRPAKE